MFALQGRGARAAHQPLELWILVRIQAPLPNSREGGAYFLHGTAYFEKLAFMVFQRAPEQLLYFVESSKTGFAANITR
jgi:hypothetical protein